jgi:flavin prenyltransferase
MNSPRESTTTSPDRVVVGITGASGAILAVRLLEALAARSTIETHVVISAAARLTIGTETDLTPEQVEALATHVYRPDDIGAAIASGSYATRGMVVIPCSIKTLSAIAHSYAADLLARAADVTLKEGRPLLLVVREAPLHLGHLRLMTQVAELGAVVFPAVPAFYARPATLDDVVNNIVGRVLARLGITNNLYAAWQGMPHTGGNAN